MAAQEAELKKLSMLPENRSCSNCNTESKFGHGNVCMPFKVFVCGHCKSAFQAYSFRVKSLTMSNFTTEEVESFKARNGGGNDHCRRTWMARLPLDDPLRPREGDHPDKHKMLVQRVFIDKAYYSDEHSAHSTAGGVTSHIPASSGGAGSVPVPSINVSNVKGRWGPQSTAAHKTDSMGRKVASGWDDQPEDRTGHDDGIKIREGPRSTNSSFSESAGGGADLLGFGGGGAHGGSSSVNTSVSSTGASGHVDDLLFGGSSSSSSATASAAPTPLSGAAILSAYSQPAAPQQGGPRPMGMPMGMGMGMPMMGGPQMGMGGMGMGMGPSSSSAGGAPMSSFGFISQPQPTMAAPTMMGAQQPVLRSGGGGLNAVMSGLNQPSSTAPAAPSASASSNSGGAKSDGGLDSLLSNFNLGSGGSSSAADKSKTAAGVPLAKIGSSNSNVSSVVGISSTASTPISSFGTPLSGTPSPALSSLGSAPGSTMIQRAPSGFGAGGMLGDPFASIMPQAPHPHPHPHPAGMPRPAMGMGMGMMGPGGMPMQPRPPQMGMGMGGGMIPQMGMGMGGPPRPPMGMGLGGAVPTPDPQTVSFNPGDPFFGI
jgi:Putative GTPase activating protein for Arf